MLAVVSKTIPANLPLAEWSMKEFDAIPTSARLALERKSDRIWTLEADGHVVMVAGVLVPALVSRPELWFLLCTGFTKTLRRNLIETRELVEQLLDLYPRVIIRVDSRYPTGHKFAEFMGFRQISHSIAHDGREYGVYEVQR